MENQIVMKGILTTLSTMALLTGCYEAEFNTTDHPVQAEVEVTVAAPTLPGGTTDEGSMTLIIDGLRGRLVIGQ